jgi:anti-sigma regulatory factor (Ser/Thr protein kinase)
MSEQVIAIHTELDVVTARMQVRNAARHVGLKTPDQARISLATTSIVRSLGLGNGHDGEVLIERVDAGGRPGLQVICRESGQTLTPLTPAALQDAQWMVDEVTIHQQSPTEIRIHLIKWLAGVIGL